MLAGALARALVRPRTAQPRDEGVHLRARRDPQLAGEPRAEPFVRRERGGDEALMLRSTSGIGKVPTKPSVSVLVIAPAITPDM